MRVLWLRVVHAQRVGESQRAVPRAGVRIGGVLSSWSLHRARTHTMQRRLCDSAMSIHVTVLLHMPLVRSIPIHRESHR